MDRNRKGDILYARTLVSRREKKVDNLNLLVWRQGEQENRSLLVVMNGSDMSLALSRGRRRYVVVTLVLNSKFSAIWSSDSVAQW